MCVDGLVADSPTMPRDKRGSGTPK